MYAGCRNYLESFRFHGDTNRTIALAGADDSALELLDVGQHALNRGIEICGITDCSVLCFSAFGISYYPFVIPGKLTITDALSDANSLRFLLVGVVIVVPCILAYTAMVYKIFSGKSEKISYY